MATDAAVKKINDEALAEFKEYERQKALYNQLKAKLDIQEHNMHAAQKKAFTALKRLKKTLDAKKQSRPLKLVDSN